MAANRQDGNLDGGWYPQMGRVRGLLQALDRIRNQQNPLHLAEAQDMPRWEGEEVSTSFPLPR